MILQSEIDQINSHERTKRLLIILTALAVAVVVYVVIKVGGREDMAVSGLLQTVPEVETTEVLTVEEVSRRLDELSKVTEGSTSLPAPSPEEVQKQLEVLSETSDGMTPPAPSSEEVTERLHVLNAK